MQFIINKNEECQYHNYILALCSNKIQHNQVLTSQNKNID